ncbi:MAG: hypothetical protein ABI340_06350 [Nitrososphaera sp.]|jgi:uncharacterized protein YaaQ
MKKTIICEDSYEAEKLSSLIFVRDENETFITGILEIIENEIIITIKDKSAHSVLFRDKTQAETFADFIQSVIENNHRIISTKVLENVVEITKE